LAIDRPELVAEEGLVVAGTLQGLAEFDLLLFDFGAVGRVAGHGSLLLARALSLRAALGVSGRDRTLGAHRHTKTLVIRWLRCCTVGDTLHE